ncbi:MAG: MOSC domain-containing protein [Firmicutes bacterium]|nr:MOSC domain-containing protein [Bacillota bacterium]
MKIQEARVCAVCVATDPRHFVTATVPQVSLEFGGIPGDRHFGLTKRASGRESNYPHGATIFNRRQITAVSLEECRLIAKILSIPLLSPNWLGANLVLEGIFDLTDLPMGCRLLFPSGAGLLCEGRNTPCIHAARAVQAHYPDRPTLAKEFIAAAAGHRGIFCIVERPGILFTEDKVKIVWERSFR